VKAKLVGIALAVAMTGAALTAAPTSATTLLTFCKGERNERLHLLVHATSCREGRRVLRSVANRMSPNASLPFVIREDDWRCKVHRHRVSEVGLPVGCSRYSVERILATLPERRLEH
jgi:hypothetical protein